MLWDRRTIVQLLFWQLFLCYFFYFCKIPTSSSQYSNIRSVRNQTVTDDNWSRLLTQRPKQNWFYLLRVLKWSDAFIYRHSQCGGESINVEVGVFWGKISLSTTRIAAFSCWQHTLVYFCFGFEFFWCKKKKCYSRDEASGTGSSADVWTRLSVQTFSKWSPASVLAWAEGCEANNQQIEKSIGAWNAPFELRFAHDTTHPSVF